MTNEDLARSYFNQAEGRLRVLEVYLKEKMYPTVVREAQECVEFLLKAALRYVGVEPMKTHDVGRILLANKKKFPLWIAGELDRLAKISSLLAEERGPSFYGDEERGLEPGALFFEEDARKALADTRFVHQICQRLFRGPGG